MTNTMETRPKNSIAEQSK